MVPSNRVSKTAVLVLLLFTLFAVGCQNGEEESQDMLAERSGEKSYEDLPQGWNQPTLIDNDWLPIEPGMRYTYEGTTIEDDGTALPHRVVITYTDLTKEIAGILTRVSYDLDYSDGELVEAELAFFAQDNEGNVWRMGEYPEEYEDGEIVDNPAWIHGQEQARAGIMMHANPQPGTPSYAQGWAPSVEWTDRGRVDQMGLVTQVPAGSFSDVLVIAETSASEPGAEQLKYYARGTGNIRVGWRGEGEKTKETLELIKIEQLDAAALARVNAAALELEKSAFKNSKNVYAKTKAIQASTDLQAGLMK